MENRKQIPGRILDYLLTPRGMYVGWGRAAGVDPAQTHLQAWHSRTWWSSCPLGPDALRLLGTSYGLLGSFMLVVPPHLSCQVTKVGGLHPVSGDFFPLRAGPGAGLLGPC